MDKVVIVGGFEYLGFSLATSFLEEGYYVDCIDIELLLEPIYEEKRFSVGRNANFQEIKIKDWVSLEQKHVEDSLIVISFYDIYLMKDHESMKMKKEIYDALLRLNINNNQFLFLLPIHFLVDLGTEIEDFTALCSELKRRNNSIKQVYIPTLYGPWQPNEYLFQQALLHVFDGERNLKLNKREYLHDAIYIEDVIREIKQIIEDNSKETSVLKSELSDHWKKCAEFLMINPEVYQVTSEQARIQPSIGSIIVKESIGLEKGLAKQKEYAKRYIKEFL